MRGVSFSRDGTKVASGSVDNTVKLWDVTSREYLQTLEGHSDSVNSVSFSRDGTKVVSRSCIQNTKISSGTKFASSSKDREYKIWDSSRDQENVHVSGA